MKHQKPQYVELSKEKKSLKKATDFDGVKLKKHIAAIRSSNFVGEVARKFSNILLVNAYDDLLDKQWHSISLAVFFEVAGYSSRNYEVAFSSLDQLQTTLLKFDVGGGAELKGAWIKNLRSSQMLGEYVVDNGVLHYSYPSMLSKSLYNPEIYQTIDLSQQKELSGSATLALWENILPYIDLEHKSTGFHTVEYWRELLGATAKTYNQFKFFKSKILLPSMKKIGEKSNFNLELKFQKTGRKITHMGFDIKEKSQKKLFPDALNVVAEYPEYKTLLGIGIIKVQALAWIQEYGREYVQKKTEYLEEENKKRTIKNPAGWLRKAVENDWIDSKAEAKILEQKQALEIQQKEREKIIIKAQEKQKEKKEEAAKFIVKENFLASLPEEEKINLLPQIKKKFVTPSLAGKQSDEVLLRRYVSEFIPEREDKISALLEEFSLEDLEEMEKKIKSEKPKPPKKKAINTKSLSPIEAEKKVKNDYVASRSVEEIQEDLKKAKARNADLAHLIIDFSEGGTGFATLRNIIPNFESQVKALTG